MKKVLVLVVSTSIARTVGFTIFKSEHTTKCATKACRNYYFTYRKAELVPKALDSLLPQHKRNGTKDATGIRNVATSN